MKYIIIAAIALAAAHSEASTIVDRTICKAELLDPVTDEVVASSESYVNFAREKHLYFRHQMDAFPVDTNVTGSQIEMAAMNISGRVGNSVVKVSFHPHYFFANKIASPETVVAYYANRHMYEVCPVGAESGDNCKSGLYGYTVTTLPFEHTDVWKPATLDSNNLPVLVHANLNKTVNIRSNDSQIDAKARLTCTPQDRRI